ncbi:hypothetical protein SeMB42_g07004 [Synchytrium endobioticum]|uniref:Uncharacterized protein n=1 Tax=Synchytrium endobioticum TaxID=286115 RepID=A0A507CCF5_9FUNG|nr:hypothetical protein SeMB42_g07004 [Synchytrium endobioticum]
MAARVNFMRNLRTASKPSFGASTCHSSPSIQSYLPNNSTTAGILNNLFSPSILSRAPVSNLYTSAAQAYRHADHSRSSHYHSLSLSSALSSPPGSFRRGISSSVSSSVSSSSSTSTGGVAGTLPAAKGRDYGQDTSFIDTTKVWVQLYEQEEGCTPIPVKGAHTIGAKLPSSSDVDELLEYLVEEKFKYEMYGIAVTRLILYHRAEDGKLQEWKDWSSNLKELQRQTQSNGVRPLCVVKPLCRSKEPEFPISVIFELKYGLKIVGVTRWINSRVTERSLSFALRHKELPINLLTDEEVEDNFRRIWASGEQILRLRIETHQRPFSDWKFSEVMAHYNLCKDSYEEQDKFQCGITEISEEVRPTFNHLVEDIQASIKAFPTVRGSSEANRSEFISRILSCVTSLFDGRFELHPQMEVAGELGRGPVDWAIRYKDGRIIGVIEAKKSDLKQGVAQNIMQLRSSDDSNKPKNLDRKEIPSTLFGMVTTAEKWVLIKVVKNGGEHKLYVDERAPYILDLRKNVSRKKLAVGLEQLFKRLLWIYEQSLPGNEGNRIKTL